MTAFSDAKSQMVEKLGGPDRSRQGSVDEAAWPFINTINEKDSYYTTSSCAGRINVFKEPLSGKKYDAEWLFVSHDEADYKDVLSSLESVPQEPLWLRMEPPIFHVACVDQEAAEKLLKVCQASGWKRSGIISTGGKRAKQRRVMVEIVGNERIDTPIAQDGALLFEKSFIRFLVKKANEKLVLTRRRLEDLRVVIDQAL